LLTFVRLFTGFLLPGFWAGRQIGNLSQEAQSIDNDQVNIEYTQMVETVYLPEDPLTGATTPPIPSSTVKNNNERILHQRNILVIGVDDLVSASPSLKSVWLIIYMPNIPHFMLLPIYPIKSISETNDLSTGGSLKEKFQLDKKKTPQISFFEAIGANDIWWNSYILMDDTALAEVSNFVGNLDNNPNFDSISAIKNVPDPEHDPLGALLGQADIVQGLCSQTVRLSTVETQQYLMLLKNIREHVRTDLNFDKTIAEWQQLLLSSGNISCEFPSLAAPNFGP
jgi:hypothetical protein